VENVFVRRAAGGGSLDRIVVPCICAVAVSRKVRFHVCLMCEEMPVPQAFIQSIENREMIAPRKHSQARRTQGKVNRRADRSSRCSDVVHHSLSGFAVFFVVL
jgi:hypothetical protein